MTVKVLVNQIGQHIVASTKQIENKETKDIIAYWVTDPRVASYSVTEEGEINVQFAPYCLISDEKEFSIRATNIVAILEPSEQVRQRYEEIVNPPVEEQQVTMDGGDDAAATDAPAA